MIKKILILPFIILALGVSYGANGTRPDSARVIVGSNAIRTISVLANDDLVAGKNYQIISVFKSLTSPNIVISFTTNNVTYQENQPSPSTDTFFYVAKDLVIGDNDTNAVVVRKSNLNLDQFPGDATKDNICNNIDVLKIGLGYNKTDQIREGNYLTDNWVAIRAYDWTSASEKSNYRYADANGDGKIDSAGDINTILKNYNKISGATSVTYSPTGGPSFELSTTVDTVKLSSNSVTIPLQIKLGSAALPVNNAYGIAFTIKYDTTVFKANQLQFTAKNWFIDQHATLNLSKLTHEAGEIDVTIVRKNGKNGGGLGELGVVDVVVIDILGLFNNPFKANFEVTKAVLIDSNYTLKPVTLATKPIYIVKTTSKVQNSVNEQPISYYVSNRHLKLENLSSKNNQIEIINLLGRRLAQDTVQGLHTKDIDMSQWSSGTYFIKTNNNVYKFSIE